MPTHTADHTAAGHTTLVTNVNTWFGNQVDATVVADWPPSVRFWLRRRAALIPDPGSDPLDPNADMLDFANRVLAITRAEGAPVSATAGRFAPGPDAGVAFLSMLHEPATATPLSDATYRSLVKQWFAHRLGLVDPSKWTAAVIDWADGDGGATTQATDLLSPPPEVLGWLGQVAGDVEIPSGAFGELGLLMQNT